MFFFVLLFVAVRSFTADSSLLQPTRGVNSTPHTSHFLVFLRTYYTHMRGSSLASAHHIPCVILMRSCGCFDSLRLLHFPLFAVHLLSYHPVFSSWPSTSSSTMWWTNSLCTPANEDLGTFAECDPLTSYDPNDYHISEATEPYIQESSDENGSLNDLEYDDVTIGKALSSQLSYSCDAELDDEIIGKALSSPLFQEREDPASRRRAYHSQDEGLSSSQSSSVGHY